MKAEVMQGRIRLAAENEGDEEALRIARDGEIFVHSGMTWRAERLSVMEIGFRENQGGATCPPPERKEEAPD